MFKKVWTRLEGICCLLAKKNKSRLEEHCQNPQCASNLTRRTHTLGNCHFRGGSFIPFNKLWPCTASNSCIVLFVVYVYGTSNGYWWFSDMFDDPLHCDLDDCHSIQESTCMFQEFFNDVGPGPPTFLQRGRHVLSGTLAWVAWGVSS